jgi:UDP-N-acetylmuramoyl-L-alanyl-D-glutamate--2,6-diaminopimelate ligase
VATPRADVCVLVDYAHTDAALERVLGVLRASLAARGRLICVFGCGGNRDRGKRAPMGAAVDALADVAVLTSDNPRDEAPEAILQDVLAGIRPGRADRFVEGDRRAAIALAARLARAGDLVLIAGKGHERVQKLAGGREVAFDDRLVAAEVFA